MERRNQMMNLPRLIVIQGPTASGKTKLATEVAKALNTVILSADSRQFYKEVSIGTAKPSLEEMQGIKHYFINSHNLEHEVSAAQFAKEAREFITKDLSHLENIVIVGGSGLFIQALCEGLDEIPHDLKLQKQLTEECKTEGLEHLLKELKDKDPLYFNLIDKQNPLRVIRAVEAMRLSGQTMTELRKGSSTQSFKQVDYYTLYPKREELYLRINQRVDEMIDLGLEKEAAQVHHLKHLKSLQTVGYKEFFDYFEGITTREKAIELIKQHSRNYAKRQNTWFKTHHPGIILHGDFQFNLDCILSNSK